MDIGCEPCRFLDHVWYSYKQFLQNNCTIMCTFKKYFKVKDTLPGSKINEEKAIAENCQI